jgi:hypothetical protein
MLSFAFFNEAGNVIETHEHAISNGVDSFGCWAE